MVEPSSLITIEFGTYGSFTGVPITEVVKSTGTTYWDWVLPIYNTVLFVPGVVISIAFETTALPLPYKPIWLKGELLQFGGWQTATIDPAPGKIGVAVEGPAVSVVGVVDSKVRFTPVSVIPFVSTTVAVTGCAKFWFTIMLVLVLFGTASVMLCGGHVEKNPAELDAFDRFDVIIVDPGACAVATPFWSIVRIVLSRGVYVMCPAKQLMFVWLVPVPTYTRAASCPVLACDKQALPEYGGRLVPSTVPGGIVQQPVAAISGLLG
jgi:hypothetical protein